MKRDDLLDLNDVLQHPGRTIDVEISTELENEENLDLLTPLEGDLHAVSTGNILLLSGHFGTRMVVECSRCAKQVEVDLEFDLEEQFAVEGVPSSLSSQDMAKVKPDEPFPLFDGNSLMVEALLRQDLLLTIPAQVFCPEGQCDYKERQNNDFGGRAEFQALKDRIPPLEP